MSSMTTLLAAVAAAPLLPVLRSRFGIRYGLAGLLAYLLAFVVISAIGGDDMQADVSLGYLIGLASSGIALLVQGRLGAARGKSVPTTASRR